MLSPSCVIYCSNTNCSNSKDILICNSCYSNGGYNCLLFIIRYLLFWGLRNYAKERKVRKVRKLHFVGAFFVSQKWQKTQIDLLNTNCHKLFIN